MLRKFLFVAILSPILLSALGQEINYSITWSKEFKEPDFGIHFLPRYDSNSILGYTDKWHGLSMRPNPVFHRLSINQGLISSKECEFKNQGIIVLNNSLFVAYKGSNQDLWIQEIDSKTLLPTTNIQKLTSLEGIVDFHFVDLQRSKKNCIHNAGSKFRQNKYLQNLRI